MLGLGTLRRQFRRLAGPSERRSAGFDPALMARILREDAATPAKALTLTAAFACINVLSSDIASLSLKVYRTKKSGAREEATDHPAYELLHLEPNEEMPAFSFRQAQWGHVHGWGNGYAEIVRASGQPATLHLLHPRTEPKRDQKKRLYYRDPDGVEYAARDVVHLRGLGFDGIKGYTPTQLARRAIELGISAEVWGKALFDNGSQGHGVLKTAQKLSPEQQKELRDQIEKVHQGAANAFRMLLLTQGLEWQSTSIAPEDAQYLALRQFQVLELCRIYRVPPHKVGDFSQAHRASVEESNIDYLMTSIMPWLVMSEQEYTRKLLSKQERAAGLFVEHNMNSFLRGNMAARSQFYRELFQIGVLTVDQISRLENLDPVEGDGGGAHFVPLNMTTLQRMVADPPAPKTKPDPTPAPTPSPTYPSQAA